MVDVKPSTYKHPSLDIGSLDQEARGVGRMPSLDGAPGKVVFVERALPGERVRYSSFRKRPSYEIANLIAVDKPSVARVTPRCPVFGVCGGCSMQHLDAGAQVAVKQRILEDNLAHIGKLRPDTLFRPIRGPSWGYRYRARLSVHFDERRGGALVGFRERKSHQVANTRTCDVLPPHVSALLAPLRELIGGLSLRDRIPQIELAVGEDITALVLRVLAPPTRADEDALRAFADRHAIQFWLQPKQSETAYPFHPIGPALTYTLPEFGIRMPFKPVDFTQVNFQINRVLVRRAMQLLAPARTDRVLDLFCGLGNFTLPLARLAREAVGVEGSEALLARARDNALQNGLQARTAFMARNLFETDATELRSWGRFDRVLLDPPRDGALALVRAWAEMARTEAALLPARMVYVSCNPATLARDAGVLVHEAGYRLRGAGIVNMFPHTSHVESIALFERA